MSAWVWTGLNLLLASCALWAAITAKSTLRELRKKLAERSTRSLAQLDAEVTALSSAFASLSTTLKRLNARQGMARLRESRKEEDLPTDPQARKAALRAKLRSGELVIRRDNLRSSTDQND